MFRYFKNEEIGGLVGDNKVQDKTLEDKLVGMLEKLKGSELDGTDGTIVGFEWTVCCERLIGIVMKLIKQWNLSKMKRKWLLHL